ncbi:MAG: bifunctional methionine sulfoxide reductase B/A protein [Sphingobacteriia bacterium]|nr:bifunctional methionine sulfoxide reductase B/A protein [Sphingobacteriia bacterium]
MLTWKNVLQFAREGSPKPDRVMNLSIEEWKQKLSPDVFEITRLRGTERPFSGEYCGVFELALYACVCCGALLFDASYKFESGTGWPSFTQPISDNAVKYSADFSHGMERIEALCNTCEAHLGHVFPDGPSPSGLRFCMNSKSLIKVEEAQVGHKETVTFGGGCFWCTEAIFESLKGVEKVRSGYSGGSIVNPTYRQVCSGTTGHAEVIQIEFDPKVISFEDLVKIHLYTHDPTTVNRQGADVGSQYRSAIFYHSEAQKLTAEKVIKALTPEFDNKIVTEVSRLANYYPAEDYHQNYYAQNATQPYCQAVISPKLAKLRAKYKDKLK